MNRRTESDPVSSSASASTIDYMYRLETYVRVETSCSALFFRAISLIQLFDTYTNGKQNLWKRWLVIEDWWPWMTLSAYSRSRKLFQGHNLAKDASDRENENVHSSTGNRGHWTRSTTDIRFFRPEVGSGHILYYIWMFVYFLCSQTPLKRRVVRRRNLARRRVTTTSRTSVGFYVYGGSSLPKNDTFKQKYLNVNKHKHFAALPAGRLGMAGLCY